MDDFLGGLPCDAALCHATAQQLGHLRHALRRAFVGHGPTQLLGLARGKARGRHGHSHDLLLEQRHAQGAGQDGLQHRVGVAHRLTPGAAVQVGVHHLAHDGAGTNQSHLDDQIIKFSRLHAWQGGHLSSALHLKDTQGVGPL